MDHQQTTRSVSGAHYAFVFCISLLLWVLLSGSLAWEEVVLGAFVSLMITLLFGPRFTIYNGIKFSFMAPLYVLLYLVHFFRELIKANFELAMRVLTPSLPIRPEMVEIKTTLESPLGRMLLANSITLTPGTLSVDVSGDTILVHWVYCPPGIDAKQATDAIAASFERHIKRFLV